MSNEDRDNSLYKYPNSSVLRNKFDLRDQKELDRAERIAVRVRFEQGSPEGDFDVKHLQSIHKHLFQDVYEWAGNLRQVDFYKTSWFLPVDRIEMGLADIHNRLSRQNFLQGLSKTEFATRAGEIIGDVNHAHPFREGNGRTQLQYLKQLGAQAGHVVDLVKIERTPWIDASIRSHHGDYDPMAKCIESAIVKGPSQKMDKKPDRLVKDAPAAPVKKRKVDMHSIAPKKSIKKDRKR